MGFFSWKTNDTNTSIANIYSGYDVISVYLIDNNNRMYKEDAYGGYGVFGGKNFYELLAEMNGLPPECSNGILLDADNNWIEFAYDNRMTRITNKAVDKQTLIKVREKGVIYPNLVENPFWEWKNEKPERCEYQGYFYP